MQFRFFSWGAVTSQGIQSGHSQPRWQGMCVCVCSSDFASWKLREPRNNNSGVQTGMRSTEKEGRILKLSDFHWWQRFPLHMRSWHFPPFSTAQWTARWAKRWQAEKLGIDFMVGLHGGCEKISMLNLCLLS